MDHNLIFLIISFHQVEVIFIFMIDFWKGKFIQIVNIRIFNNNKVAIKSRINSGSFISDESLKFLLILHF